MLAKPEAVDPEGMQTVINRLSSLSFRNSLFLVKLLRQCSALSGYLLTGMKHWLTKFFQIVSIRILRSSKSAHPYISDLTADRSDTCTAAT